MAVNVTPKLISVDTTVGHNMPKQHHCVDAIKEII